MRKRIFFLLGLSLLLSAGLGLFWFTSGESVEAQTSSLSDHPFKTINQKASLARTGDLSNAEEYVSEIISVAGFESELRGFTATTIKDRVGRAESRFRQGQAAGVPVQKIVRTVNGLVLKFKLPEYTRTNVAEVTRLRFMLLPNFPEVIRRNAQSKQAITVGSRFESEMSPAEAVFVLMMMLQQKLHNPEYQLTDSERRSLWNEMHAYRPDLSLSPQLPKNRNVEMLATLNRAGRSMPFSDTFQLSDITLNTLGIEKEGGNGQ